MAINNVESTLADPKYVKALEDELRDLRRIVTQLQFDVTAQQRRK